MSFRVHGLTWPITAAGLRIAGLAADDASSAEDASRRLAELAAAPDVGVILMDQALFDQIPDALRHQLARRALPIVVPIPRPMRVPGEGGEDYILELLRRAIGYRVRLT
jgi:vacuolar-type H+-ATPase subunit F/Vma7